MIKDLLNYIEDEVRGKKPHEKSDVSIEGGSLITKQWIINLLNDLKMKNLPKEMIPDKDNQVYYDTENEMFYMIKWTDTGNRDVPTRYYIK